MRCLNRGDHDWPAQFGDLTDQPLQIWINGTVLPQRPAVAIVGARTPTAAGLAIAEDIGRGLGAAGVQVVSGFARGVDAAAHRGSLEGGGSTIAVLGCGIDFDYPRTHNQLRRDIAASGALLTEHPPGTEPRPTYFPRRNRLIAALADAVIVVEARARSGALSTARWAADLGREVLAVPGSIRNPMSLGANLLIRDGARPYLEFADLIDALPEFSLRPHQGESSSNTNASSLSAPEKRILELLSPEGVHPDILGAHTQIDAASLGAHLTNLELSGHLVTLPGGLVASFQQFRPQPGRLV